MAPLVKLLGAGSLLAGLIAALTSRFSRRKRKAKEAEVDNSTASTAACASASAEPASSSCSSTLQRSAQGPSQSSWLPPPLQPRHPPHVRPPAPPGYNSVRGRSLSGDREGREGRSSEGQGSSGLLSRLLAAGRLSESLESGVSFSVDTAGSSSHGGYDEYDSSEEQDVEGSAESRSGYGKSDRARLVDLWIESALLVSRDLRLDKRHFDRTTRQNLKKMRPASAQLILAEIADRSWDATPDIAKEIHRLVSHAKAQDKFASAPPPSPPPSAAAASAVATTGSGFGPGPGLGPSLVIGRAPAAAAGVAEMAVASLIGPGRGGGAGMGVGVGLAPAGTPVAVAARSPAAAGGPAGGVGGVPGAANRIYHAVM